MSLVSDLIEEWRAILVDDTVMQLILREEIAPDLFVPSETNGIHISRDGIRIISRALGDKIIKAKHYLKYESFKCGFQYACERQVLRLIRAMQLDDPSVYMAVESDFDD